jgi:hypothetical protein
MQSSGLTYRQSAAGAAPPQLAEHGSYTHPVRRIGALSRWFRVATIVASIMAQPAEG